MSGWCGAFYGAPCDCPDGICLRCAWPAEGKPCIALAACGWLGRCDGVSLPRCWGPR